MAATMVDEDEGGFTPDYLIRSLDTDFTVARLREGFDAHEESVVTDAGELHFDTQSDSVTFGNVELPVTDRTVEALAAWLQIPVPFLKRQENDVRDMLISALVDKCATDRVRVVYGDTSILEIRDPEREVIDPRSVVDIAANVVGDDALVTNAFRTAAEYRFDIVTFDRAMRDFDGGALGNPRVGDMTQGGLSIGQDTKRGLAPWVQPYMMRLVCTNGMVLPENDLRIDARGQSVDEVLSDLERAAEAAFSRVEAQAAAMYDLRNEVVGDTAAAVLRVGREQGLSDRVLTSAIERIPAVVPDPDDGTMFDVVNVLTNIANHTDLRGRANTRAGLERAGGAVVSTHSARCPRCHSSLTR